MVPLFLPALGGLLARIGLSAAARGAASAGARAVAGTAGRSVAGGAARGGGKAGLSRAAGQAAPRGTGSVPAPKWRDLGLKDKATVVKNTVNNIFGRESEGAKEERREKASRADEPINLSQLMSEQPGKMGDVMAGKTSGADVAAEEQDSRKRAQDEEALQKTLKKTKQVFNAILPPTVLLGTGFVGLVKTVQSVSSALFNHQSTLAQYNATIASAMLEHEAHKIGLQVEKGAGTAGSTKDLGRSLAKLEETMAPYSGQMTNLMNWLATKASDLSEWGIKFLENSWFTAKLAKEIKEDWEKAKQEAGVPPNMYDTLSRFAETARSGKWRNKVKVGNVEYEKENKRWRRKPPTPPAGGHH